MKEKIKKQLVKVAIISAFLLGVVYLYYRTPKYVRLEHQGIYYQLGNPDMAEEITIIFDGDLTRGLWLEDSFEGTITIGDKVLKQVNMRLFKNSQNPIVYFDDETRDYATYGSLFSKDIKKNFTISVFQYDKEDDSDGWSSADGYMISSPAKDRKEALELSNQLLEKELLKDLE